MVNIKIGEKHNRLTYLGYVGLDKYNRRQGKFACDCGKNRIASIGRVKSGTIKSCGCLAHDTKPNLTHGMRFTKEYRTWVSLKQRVTNSKDKDYLKYSTLEHDSDVIESFESFFEEVGRCPSGKYSIDRIDTRLGYKKGNMRWASRSEQQTNKINSYYVFIKGIRFNSLVEAAKYYGVAIQTVHKWCRGYWDRNKFRNKKSWTKTVRKYI